MVDQATVLTQYLAGRVDHVAGDPDIGPPFRHKVGVRAIADETDLLAFRLLRHRQVEGASQCPRLRLVKPAEGKMEEAELVLVKGIEDVALILARIDSA